MKAIHLSQVEPREYASIVTPADLAAAIRAAVQDTLEQVQDDTASNDIQEAVESMLNDDESYEEFMDYDEPGGPEDFYRVGGTICIHYHASGSLVYGTAEGHAAAAVRDFRSYVADERAELSNG